MVGSLKAPTSVCILPQLGFFFSEIRISNYLSKLHTRGIRFHLVLPGDYSVVGRRIQFHLLLQATTPWFIDKKFVSSEILTI